MTRAGAATQSAEIEAQAESLSPTSTRVVVTTDLHITGKVAQFGRGIIGDVSKKLMAQFAGNLNTMLDEAPSAETAPTTVPEAADGDGAETALEADTPAAVDTPKAADTGPAAAPVAEAPKVRKIDSPASEPVDLAGVAGPAVLKRLVPVVVVLLLVLLVLRRRR